MIKWGLGGRRLVRPNSLLIRSRYLQQRHALFQIQRCSGYLWEAAPQQRNGAAYVRSRVVPPNRHACCLGISSSRRGSLGALHQIQMSKFSCLNNASSVVAGPAANRPSQMLGAKERMRSYRVLVGALRAHTAMSPPHTLSLPLAPFRVHDHQQRPTTVGMWISLRKPGCLGTRSWRG